ncbi:MAG TPA: PspA/IM30 family protein [Ktedonobacterales bacterium]
MGVISRFTTYIKSLFSGALDRAEDPGQTLDYSYQVQLEQLQKIRRSIADVATSEKRLELQQAQVNAQIAKLDDQARTAVTAGRDDLARMAIERKQSLQGQIDTFNQQTEQLKAQQQKFVEMEQRLSSRVEAFRTQKEMVKAQYGAAQAQVKIQEATTGMSEEMQDVNLAVQRAQDKVLQMQARANALDELVSQGTLPEIGGSNDPLDRQLAQLGAGNKVDDELAQLKSQIAAPAPQAQLPPPATGETTPAE